MIKFFKTVVMGAVGVGICGALLAFGTIIIAIPLLDLFGWEDYSEQFGDFQKYHFYDWMRFLKFAAVFAGGIGFLFFALFGHSIGWGIALRKVVSPYLKIPLGFVGAITAVLWFVALLYVIEPEKQIDHFSEFVTHPTIIFVELLMAVLSCLLILYTYRTNWWEIDSKTGAE